MILSSNRLKALTMILNADFSNELEGPLRESVMRFYSNLMKNLEHNLGRDDASVSVNIPIGKLSQADLMLLDAMLQNAGWSVKEMDRDYYRVVPSTEELTEEQRVMRGERCPYCGVDTVFEGTSYVCPQCNASVECHVGTTMAMGFVAREPLRKLRDALHNSMDTLWKERKITRSEVYYRLRKKMELTKAECHVARFDHKQCALALDKVEEIKNEIIKEQESKDERTNEIGGLEGYEESR